MNNGTIKWFNYDKSYGFITPEDGSKDVFLHISSLEKSNINFIEEGQKVSYEIATHKGKQSAVNVKLLD